jgi:hypothetical protein
LDLARLGTKPMSGSMGEDRQFEPLQTTRRPGVSGQSREGVGVEGMLAAWPTLEISSYGDWSHEATGRADVWERLPASGAYLEGGLIWRVSNSNAARLLAANR